MNLDLTAQKVRLSWKDILWGYENKYLGWADVAAYARKMTLSYHDERVFKLSLINRGLGSKNIKLGYFEASSLIFYLNLHAGG
ncbi:DUF2247 family protein [Neisseria meningitidis]|nr:DUF2247 family protein [Neisseria meningitidis]MBG9137757.1 DUF2247 family protein [Neisseria meningitidis]